jgi:hypothetical protein
MVRTNIDDIGFVVWPIVGISQGLDVMGFGVISVT